MLESVHEIFDLINYIKYDVFNFKKTVAHRLNLCIKGVVQDQKTVSAFS